SGGDKILSISKEIERNSHLRDNKKRVHQNYHKLAKALELPTVSTEHTFLTNQNRIKDNLTQIETQKEQLQNKKSLQQNFLATKKRKKQELVEEIAFLSHRKSNIPKQNSDIRDKIAQELGIELPFVGELLKVNDKSWEGAIERVLRPFALSLLVTEDDYTKVSRYIDKTNLKGRIVYLKVTEPKTVSTQIDESSLLSKIDIHHNTPFYNWIESELHFRFNYICAENLTEFRRFKKAITQNGQIKSSLTRHEKDDRFDVNDQRRFVLGWENREKLQALKQDAFELQKQLNILEDELKTLNTQIKNIEKSRDTLRDMNHFDSFEMIDWYSIAKKIEELKSQKEELEKSSDIIKTLENRLEQVEIDTKEKRTLLNTLHQKQGKIHSDIDKYSYEKTEAQDLYISKQESLQRYDIELKSYLKEEKIGKIELHTIKKDELKVRESIQK
ncbi:MAG: hypothetical protein KAU90_09080, partial [Sulfurovaceae bacterium]|nr:hypothetical protein [Sulfurovaceae bacterium]